MLHYSETGKTKSGEIKITRPCFALLISVSGTFDAIANERISIEIERNNGSNTIIANQLFLKPLMAVASHGLPAIKQTATEVSAVIPLAMGAIPLQDSESIKVTMDGLNASKTYSVASVEHAAKAVSAFKYDSKVMVSDDTAREIQIQGFAKMHLSNIDVISQVLLKHTATGTTVKMEIAELLALAELDDPYFLNAEGVISMSPANSLVLDIREYSFIEIVKASGTSVTLTLRN